MSYRERLTLDVRGKPKWSGDQGRLELYYDELSDQFRVIQPVTTDDSRQDSPLANETAALDIGANNIVACTTTTGQQYLYEGRDLFERFREATRRIADHQSKVKREEGRYTSKRIRRSYRRRTRRRDHAMDAPARDLFERLYEEGVSTVYVGDFTDVLVGASERQDAQLLGVPRVHRPAGVYRRRVRHHRRSPPRSVDGSDVSAVRFDQEHDSAPRHAHLFVWLRGPRGPHCVGDVPPTQRIERTTADGTARMPQVGRPPMVGVTTRSLSHRGAYRPASYRRGICVAEPPRWNPRALARGGCQRAQFCLPDLAMSVEQRDLFNALRSESHTNDGQTSI
jgi:hypothetical protein